MNITSAAPWLVTNVILIALGAGMAFTGYLGLMEAVARISNWPWMWWGVVVLMFTWTAIGFFAAIFCLYNAVMVLLGIAISVVKYQSSKLSKIN